MKVKIKSHWRRLVPKTRSLMTHNQIKALRVLIRHAQTYKVTGSSFDPELIRVTYQVSPNSDWKQALVYRDGFVLHQ